MVEKLGRPLNIFFKRSRSNVSYVILVWIAFLIVIGLLGLFNNTTAFYRLWEAIRDFGNSIAFTFCELFEIPHDIIPTVKELPKLPDVPIIPPLLPGDGLIPDSFIPADNELYDLRMRMYSKSLLNGESYQMYYTGVLLICLIVMQILVTVLPVIVGGIILLKKRKPTTCTEYKDSKPLKVYKSLRESVLIPGARWCRYMLYTMRSNSVFKTILVLQLLLYFNVFTIILEFIAYYLYFLTSFSFELMYRQFYKLLYDLVPFFKYAIVWLPTLLLVVRGRIYSTGLWKLRKYEAQNKALILKMEIVNFFVGVMGSMKTLTMTDMSALTDDMFRDDAHKLMLECDLMFPHFPWIMLERHLQANIESKEIRNWATLDIFVDKIFEEFFATGDASLLFGYNTDIEQTAFKNGLEYKHLHDVVKSYGELYFLYTVPKSIVISNYSERSDNYLISQGNFPLWNKDAYSRTEDDVEYNSDYSAILDRDMIRTGRKYVENNPLAGAFEFGVFSDTEVDKEDGNKNTNEGLKPGDLAPNPKNDGANIFKKMIRHSSTIMGKCFARYYMDAQRPDSLNADLRQLSTIVKLERASERRVTLPGFWMVKLLHELVVERFNNKYQNDRFMRADNRLIMYLHKSLAASLNTYYVKRFNHYGYFLLPMTFEKGNGEGEGEMHIYRLMTKRIFSRRYATDALKGFMRENAKDCRLGFYDFKRYKSVYATKDEFMAQHSYMINNMTDPDWREKFGQSDGNNNDKGYDKSINKFFS